MRYVNKTDLLVVARNLGALMIGIGLMCLVPIVVDVIFLEFNAIKFIIPALISIGLGFIFIKALDKYTHNNIRLKHGMLISALSWLWAVIVCGAILCWVTDISFIDGAFECMSALT